MFKVEMLPARHGDAIWIAYGDESRPSRVLIDGGLSGTYDDIKARAGKKCQLELMCVTHIDQDHIEGSVKLLANLPKGMSIGEIWYNGYDQISRATRLGAAQGEKLGAAIVNHANVPWNAKFDGQAVVVPGKGDLPEKVLDGGLTITLLSPGKPQLTKLKPVWERECTKAGLIPGSLETAEAALQADRKLKPRRLGAKLDVGELAEVEFESDTAPANGSSIAFLAEYGGKSVLFAADAHSPVVEAGIRRLLAQRNLTELKLDAFKVSHHGSKFNNSHTLIGLLDCPAFLFSSNGDKFNHPDPETIARILKAREGEQTHLWFNYRSEQNEVWDVAGLKKSWKYKTHYPEGETEGIQVQL